MVYTTLPFIINITLIGFLSSMIVTVTSKTPMIFEIYAKFDNVCR